MGTGDGSDLEGVGLGVFCGFEGGGEAALGGDEVVGGIMFIGTGNCSLNEGKQAS